MSPGRNRKRVSVTKLAAAVLLAYAVSGCLIMPEGVPDYGIKDPDKLAGLVEPGKTTKRELLRRFGPPFVITARDETAAIPLIYDHAYERRGNSYAVRSEAWFELFSRSSNLTEYHRIYYYYSASRSRILMFFWLFDYRGGSTETDRIWLLVNEKTGIVEDIAFKKHGKPVLFGAKRAASQKEKAGFAP